MSAKRIDMDRLRQLCAKKLDAVQIGARLGIRPDSVREACKRHGIVIAAAPRANTDISWCSPS